MIYWREDKQAWVESSGRLVHDAMRWAILNNERDGAHVWLEGGKSRFQEEARRTAAQIAETIQPAEEKLFCRYCGGDVKDGACLSCGKPDAPQAGVVVGLDFPIMKLQHRAAYERECAEPGIGVDGLELRDDDTLRQKADAILRAEACEAAVAILLAATASPAASRGWRADSEAGPEDKS